MMRSSVQSWDQSRHSLAVISIRVAKPLHQLSLFENDDRIQTRNERCDDDVDPEVVRHQREPNKPQQHTQVARMADSGIDALGHQLLWTTFSLDLLDTNEFGDGKLFLHRLANDGRYYEARQPNRT